MCPLLNIKTKIEHVLLFWSGCLLHTWSLILYSFLIGSYFIRTCAVIKQKSVKIKKESKSKVMRRSPKFHEFYKQQVSAERQNDKKWDFVSLDIMVQRMSSVLCSLRKVEKVWTIRHWDFVPFKGFTVLSIENIEVAAIQILIDNQYPNNWNQRSKR